ncbi:Splicing factor 45 [Amphibalanus amphitrite]|uniref:Splicing factor 45 n=1 Tax=Amphibalanus amphitrite TaxID=1232801 RepID=A0A6A4WU99_AMPAM|nr:Splicing factor 45 [Amphibalanus amphitrite]
MSLYDDIDSGQKSDRVPGWGSSNMKLLQSQLKLRKAAVSQPRRDLSRRGNVLAPVIDLKGTRREDEDSPAAAAAATAVLTMPGLNQRGYRGPAQFISFGPDQDAKNEYDPLKPNDYEKVVKAARRKKEEEKERERREREMAGPVTSLVSSYSDDEAETAAEEERKRKSALGAAIAPPSALQERSSSPPSFGLGAPRPSGFRRRGQHRRSDHGQIWVQGLPSPLLYRLYLTIARSGGRQEGQGLGKAGQGISRALAVEKTSKRGGRIIHERELLTAGSPGPSGTNTPPQGGGSDLMPPPPPPPPPAQPTMAEILRNPTKIVMLRNMVGAGEVSVARLSACHCDPPPPLPKNMVGAGEVDDELEGEVKEECSTKYGEVVKVTILEVSGASDNEAVRIFVEFKRIENSIKALVDLNGRFFGGRQVKARFYKQDLYDDLELNEHVP